MMDINSSQAADRIAALLAAPESRTLDFKRISDKHKKIVETESVPTGDALGRILAVAQRVVHVDGEVGMVPVENSTEGTINRTLDLLLTTPAKVCGEIMLPVRQNLMSKAKDRAAIKKVYSHTQSLAQK